MRIALGKLLTQEAHQQATLFQARSTDVFVATYPKSGTTWMQQIVHGLRSSGSMDFGEITEVVPWLEACSDLGQDPHAQQVGGFRAFKTHFSYDLVPKDARYIYVVRDPKDVLLSFYRFFEGFMFEPGSISLTDFAHTFFMSGSKSGKYWDHICSYWAIRQQPNMLMLTFESLKQNLAPAVEKVARFIGLQPTPEQMERVLHQSSYGFMSAHGHHFDDHFLIQNRRVAAGLPEDAVASKVQKGESGAAVKQLPADLHALLDARWKADIEATIGFANYADLRAAIDATTESA